MILRVSAVSGVFFVALLLGAFPVAAQDSLSVTITPPLFQLTIGPGESWSSSVKVVNNNAYDVTYAPRVVDFEADGERGQGKFLPLIESFANEPRATDSLGSWIEISKDPITVPAGRSGEIPFTVRVPENADPGGHYAAIMVGPYDESPATGGSEMKVSSFVTSLLFVRIKGEIIESGRIREFIADRSLYQTPNATFALRFENTGNTHLRPQGAITLYNMWGKERGKVLINEKSNFGNVLPRTIRKFNFDWSGEGSVFDIGQYSAVVTLAYGEDGRQNTTATTYFWVIPIVPVAITVGTVFTVVLLMTWLIRRYIRRALALERAYRGIPDALNATVMQVSTVQALVRPIQQGVVDLRSVASAAQVASGSTVPTSLTAMQFLVQYRLFFVFLMLIVAIGTMGSVYVKDVLTPERAFEITGVDQDDEVVDVGQ